MSIHVAIVHKPYDEHILAGRKTVEARLTKTSVPPFGCIKPGDRIYFQRSSGPFFAVATAARVWMADRLEAADIDRIHKQFNDAIRGDRTIWSKWRRSAKYAVLVWLRDVTATIESPIYKTQNMRAWYVLDDAAKPRDRTGAFEVTLTGGAIRNHYVRRQQAVAGRTTDHLASPRRADRQDRSDRSQPAQRHVPLARLGIVVCQASAPGR